MKEEYTIFQEEFEKNRDNLLSAIRDTTNDEEFRRRIDTVIYDIKTFMTLWPACKDEKTFKTEWPRLLKDAEQAKIEFANRFRKLEMKLRGVDIHIYPIDEIVITQENFLNIDPKKKIISISY